MADVLTSGFGGCRHSGRSHVAGPGEDVETESVSWFIPTVLWFADQERQREKARRAILDLMTRVPGDTARAMLNTVSSLACLHKRYLKSTFGFEVRRNRWLRARRPEPVNRFETTVAGNY